MESVLGRYRNLIVLVGVLFAQVLGLAVQVRRTTDNEPTRLIRIWAVGTVTPFERVLVWARTSTNNIWHNYFYLRGVRAENRSLKAQIERMNLEQVRMSQDADQARRLQALLAFKEQYISQTMAAQVIGSSGSEQSRLVYIDKGEKDGIKSDMAVITADGVVGKVLNVYRSVSQVLLINDHSSGVGAILEKSRTQGIVRGTAAGEVMLEKVMSDEIVPVGEQVLTSGGDSIFPKGLLVGRVTKVAPGSELFLNIRVSPAADLSKLEEVLVVTKIDERQVQPDKTGAARAVDILAERLPTVPSKPENAEKAATPGADTPRIVTPKSVAPETVSPTTATPKTLAPTIVGPDVKPRTAPSNASIGSGATTAHKSATPLSTNSSASTTKPAAAADATKEPNAQPVVEGAPR
ncbi:MAG TPA: rod shape-determining protein MreC [Terriglobales bacterium]|jgi:rod shape-determining protein MreC|nr:rod shape-determining protein MreC [Terriglobales bacterium]